MAKIDDLTRVWVDLTGPQQYAMIELRRGKTRTTRGGTNHMNHSTFLALKYRGLVYTEEGQIFLTEAGERLVSGRS